MAWGRINGLYWYLRINRTKRFMLEMECAEDRTWSLERALREKLVPYVIMNKKEILTSGAI